MISRRFPRLAALAIVGTAFAHAGITFTCDPTINGTLAGLCNTLQTTTAGLYNNTFANAGASIYITFGATGLGSSSTVSNLIPFSTYINALTAAATGSPLQTAALSALKTYAAPLYGTGMVGVASALGASLGIPGIYGVTPTAVCAYPAAGCYAGVITLTSVPNTFSFRNGAGTARQYDFFSTVEHEVDEVLGTASCIDTTGASLMNICGTNVPSAVDLFRYSAVGKLIPDSSLSTTPGAYFSYNGGITDVAANLFYNTLSNGEDYGDFAAQRCGGAGPFYVQNASACPGAPPLDITTDGNVEIDILNALGYNLASVTGLPAISKSGVVTSGTSSTTIEPGSWVAIYGTNLAPATTTWANYIVNNALPTSIQGVSVSINNKPAYIYYMSPTQINVQAPDDTATGPVSVTVTTPAGTSSAATVTLASASPAFFTLDGKYAAGVIPSSTGAYLSGTANAYDLLGPSGLFSYNTRPVKKGELLELFSTGFGAANPPVVSGKVYSGAAQTIYPVRLTLGGVAINTVAYITGAGLYQINVTIPTNAPSGDNELMALVNGVMSPTGIYVTVQ